MTDDELSEGLRFPSAGHGTIWPYTGFRPVMSDWKLPR